MKRVRDRTRRMVGAILLMSCGSILIIIGAVYLGLLLAGTWGGIIEAVGAFFVVVVFYEKWIVPVIFEKNMRNKERR